jgi:hypothetical protein
MLIIKSIHFGWARNCHRKRIGRIGKNLSDVLDIVNRKGEEARQGCSPTRAAYRLIVGNVT